MVVQPISQSINPLLPQTANSTLINGVLKLWILNQMESRLWNARLWLCYCLLAFGSAGPDTALFLCLQNNIHMRSDSLPWLYDSVSWLWWWYKRMKSQWAALSEHFWVSFYSEASYISVQWLWCCAAIWRMETAAMERHVVSGAHEIHPVSLQYSMWWALLRSWLLPDMLTS